jgi:hypothetical protein
MGSSMDEFFSDLASGHPCQTQVLLICGICGFSSVFPVFSVSSQLSQFDRHEGALGRTDVVRARANQLVVLSLLFEVS